MLQRNLQQRRDRYRHLEPDIPSLVRNRAYVPDLTWQ